MEEAEDDHDILKKILTAEELKLVPNEIANKLGKYFIENFEQFITSKASFQHDKQRLEKKLKKLQKDLQDRELDLEKYRDKLELSSNYTSDLKSKLDSSKNRILKLEELLKRLQKENSDLLHQQASAIEEHLEAERRNKEVERLNTELSFLRTLLHSAVTTKCQTTSQIEEIQSRELNLDFKEKLLDQERNQQINSFKVELSKRISELQATRAESSARASSTNSGKKLITKLNHDCLAKVLMHLPVVERLEMEKVCQKWKTAVEFSWCNVKKLDWNDLMITLDERGKKLKMIMKKCGQYLTHLKISGDLYPWISSVLKKNCQNVTNFSIEEQYGSDKYEISNQELVKIVKGMPKLKYLEIKIFIEDFPNYFNKILDNLPEKIEEIHLTAIETCSEPAPVLNKFNGLRCLSLNGFILTNETLREGILQNKNTFSKLDLSYCTFPSNAVPLFSNLKNLEYLNLDHVENFNVNEIILIAHNCSKLKYFEFGDKRSYGSRPEYIPYCIFSELKYLNLDYLSFYGIDTSNIPDGNIISGIAHNWKQLKHLNLDGKIVFSLLDLQEIAKFENLEYLRIPSTKHMNSQLFINITSSCLELKELHMNFKEISEAALEKLTNLKKLEKFTGFCKLNGNLLTKIANNCKNLVDLELYDCPNITEASLLEVGKLQHLKSLTMDSINNVPNAMFFNLKKLKYLTCRCCPSITDEAIIKVLDNCQKLRVLDVTLTGITSRSLIHASKRKFVFRPLDIYATFSDELKLLLEVLFLRGDVNFYFYD